jgi:hypothetical protein
MDLLAIPTFNVCGERYSHRVQVRDNGMCETGGTLLDKCSQRYPQGLREERNRKSGRERFGACH